MEVFPFHHRNLLFKIITDYDLTFQEARDILDYLFAEKAFDEEGENWGDGKVFNMELGHIRYVVDVNGFEVVVYRGAELQI